MNSKKDNSKSLKDIAKKRERKHFLKVIIVLFVIVVLLRVFIFGSMTVIGESMIPTYHENDIVLILKAAYWVAEPQVGDVVIVIEPTSNTHVVKRVAAVAGDTVDYKGHQIVINEGEIYIRGDNTGHTVDSDTYGAVVKDRIIGRVIYDF